MNCWRSSNCEYCSESYILRSMYDWKEGSKRRAKSNYKTTLYMTHTLLHPISVMMQVYIVENLKKLWPHTTRPYQCEHLDRFHMHVNTKRKHFEWQMPLSQTTLLRNGTWMVLSHRSTDPLRLAQCIQLWAQQRKVGSLWSLLVPATQHQVVPKEQQQQWINYSCSDCSV